MIIKTYTDDDDRLFVMVGTLGVVMMGFDPEGKARSELFALPSDATEADAALLVKKKELRLLATYDTEQERRPIDRRVAASRQ